MSRLAIETRIPAPVIGLALLGAMRAWAHASGLTGDDSPARLQLAIALAVASGLVAAAAFASFWRARTTIDPLHPARATSLVTHGVFRLSRNPMYLSMLMLLAAYALRMGGVVLWAGPLGYALYVTRFQIVPEDRALEARFGEAYRAYRRRTRRWL